MTALRYSARTGGCTVLGPGRRSVLWVYGCCFSCAGCIGGRFKDGPWQETSAGEAAAWYLEQCDEGLTISGGEPMLQAAVLSDMIDAIRRVRDCGVIVYTGFTYEALLERAGDDAGVRNFLNRIDLLIDGPYIQELDRNQPYRGSENQRFLALTGLYRQALDTYYGSAAARQTELRLEKERTLLVGVPSREQADVWQKIKRLGDTGRV